MMKTLEVHLPSLNLKNVIPDYVPLNCIYIVPFSLPGPLPYRIPSCMPGLPELLYENDIKRCFDSSTVYQLNLPDYIFDGGLIP